MRIGARHVGYGALLLGLTALAGVAALWLGDAENEATRFQVRREGLGQSLHERGVLVAMNAVPVELVTSGEIMTITPSGTRVSKGDIVVRIDESDRVDNLDDRLLDIESTQTDLDIQKAQLELTRLKAGNELNLLQAKLKLARLELQDAVNGLTQEDRRLQQIQLETAKLDLLDAEDELARQERLREKGFVSVAMVEPFRRRVKTARARVEELQTEFEIREKGVPAEKRLELQQAVDRIESQIARSARATERKLDLVRSQMEVSEARIKELTYQADNTRAEIAGAAVPAGADGIMQVHLYSDWRSGGRWIEYKPGVQKHERDRVATIVNPGAMRVDLMIHECDIHRLREGQEALVRLPAYPEKAFRGKLVEVGGIGRDRRDVAPRGYESGGEAGVSMFNASVSLESDDVEFRPGMSALVEIVTEEPVERLVIPREAVRRKDDTFRVRRDTGWTEIKGRYLDEHWFEVTDGLREGETVLALRKGGEG